MVEQGVGPTQTNDKPVPGIDLLSQSPYQSRRKAWWLTKRKRTMGVCPRTVEKRSGFIPLYQALWPRRPLGNPKVREHFRFKRCI